MKKKKEFIMTDSIDFDKHHLTIKLACSEFRRLKIIENLNDNSLCGQVNYILEEYTDTYIDKQN